jgi:hypothetical protein
MADGIMGTLLNSAEGILHMSFPPGLAYSRNVEPIAYLELGGRPAFKMALHRAGERWYWYCAHLWESGWSIVEVTDPARPRFVRSIEGPSLTQRSTPAAARLRRAAARALGLIAVTLTCRESLAARGMTDYGKRLRSSTRSSTRSTP